MLFFFLTKSWCNSSHNQNTTSLCCEPWSPTALTAWTVPVHAYKQGGKHGPCQASADPRPRACAAQLPVNHQRVRGRVLHPQLLPGCQDEHRPTASVERSRVLGPSPALPGLGNATAANVSKMNISR